MTFWKVSSPWASTLLCATTLPLLFRNATIRGDGRVASPVTRTVAFTVLVGSADEISSS